ncbi:tripartite tricarboxylate transporter substrate binding protein [Noviherbaspirillum aerium]|uniref:tripartite tricarboxylate transporter substrate binding protein n=1 Tax=Noviherbaspirillum aerium TaxID=2588497 RepID=UPI00124ED2AA|nr:tripartite tricarboxylate transporter substrate binding protein [Noviherbaspirillum aerium]
MTHLTRRDFLAASAAMAASYIAGPVLANNYPSRPIRIISPYSPGGGADMVARMVAQKLTETMGWTVIVENKPGANSMIGAGAVAKGDADGYTLLITDTAHATNPAVQPKIAFDTSKDFAPITLIGSSPQLLVANPSFPANSLKEMLAFPRDRVNGSAVGTGGSGSVAHLLSEMLKLKSGIDLVHVPYKGGGAALTDAVGGQIPLVINSMPAAMPFIEQKRLKVLAIASTARNPKLPQVQTISESIPGIVGSAWYGVLAPAKTPANILQQVNESIAKVLALPDVKAKLAASYIDPLPVGPEAFSKFLTEEIARWQSVAKQANIKLD